MQFAVHHHCLDLRQVANYKVPVCESHDEVIDNCKRIADMIRGSKLGYPGLDLVRSNMSTMRNCPTVFARPTLVDRLL